MKKIRLEVPSMHCNHCVHTIKMELTELDGVQDVAVDLNKKIVDVEFDLPATETSIRDLLVEINYPPEK